MTLLWPAPRASRRSRITRREKSAPMNSRRFGEIPETRRQSRSFAKPRTTLLRPQKRKPTKPLRLPQPQRPPRTEPRQTQRKLNKLPTRPAPLPMQQSRPTRTASRKWRNVKGRKPAGRREVGPQQVVGQLLGEERQRVVAQHRRQARAAALHIRLQMIARRFLKTATP